MGSSRCIRQALSMKGDMLRGKTCTKRSWPTSFLPFRMSSGDIFARNFSQVTTCENGRIFGSLLSNTTGIALVTKQSYKALRTCEARPVMHPQLPMFYKRSCLSDSNGCTNCVFGSFRMPITQRDLCRKCNFGMQTTTTLA